MRFNACRVFFSSIQIVKLLIKKGVYVNERFYSGDSVLHYIVSPKEWEETNASDYIEAVRALIANGADPTLVNNDGKTTFDVAQNETIRAVLVQAVSFLYDSIERIFFMHHCFLLLYSISLFGLVLVLFIVFAILLCLLQVFKIFRLCHLQLVRSHFEISVTNYHGL